MPDPTDWEKLKIDEPIVRDVMAIERTILANERTFLAFWRTALTMFIAGVTFIHYFSGTVYDVLGWIFIPTGLAVFVYGFRVYRRMGKVIKNAELVVEEVENRKNESVPA